MLCCVVLCCIVLNWLDLIVCLFGLFILFGLACLFDCLLFCVFVCLLVWYVFVCLVVCLFGLVWFVLLCVVLSVGFCRADCSC